MKLFDFLLKEKEKEIKEEKEVKEKEEITPVTINNNYEIVEYDDKKHISFKYGGYGWTYSCNIPLDSVIEYSNDKIVCVNMFFVNNLDGIYTQKSILNKYKKSIYLKTDLEESKSIYKYTYIYNNNNKCYDKAKQETVGENIDLKILSPYKCFCELCHHFEMIENDDEFNDYINSTLSYEDWSRKKLIEKMLELGLGNGFINSFADLIGDNVDKYHQMIDLATEVENKDILMYLFVNKFKE